LRERPVAELLAGEVSFGDPPMRAAPQAASAS
jgi:hypothetical protein